MGNLHDTVYMHQPPDFVDPTKPNHVCLLSKALYDLKQSLRVWFKFLLSLSFSASHYDPFLFALHDQTIIILMYVDDIIITGSHSAMADHFIVALQSKFPIKDLRDLSFFLDIEVQKISNGLHLSHQRILNLMIFH
jgi:Reverse transcriptase (RNA-dependent DNA polymerase)